MKMNVGLRSIFVYLFLMLIFLILRRNYDFLAQYSAAAMGAFGSLSYLLAKVIAREIQEYTPSSASDAKICNERIKLVASLFNAIAIALVVGAFVQPIVKMNFEVFTIQNILMITIGIVFHAGAHRVLSMMKDDKKYGE